MTVSALCLVHISITLCAPLSFKPNKLIVVDWKIGRVLVYLISFSTRSEVWGTNQLSLIYSPKSICKDVHILKICSKIEDGMCVDESTLPCSITKAPL